MVRLDRTEIPANTRISSLTLNELRTEYKLKDVHSAINGMTMYNYNYNEMSNYELRIPTMDEYFDICAIYGVIPFIELKEDGGIVSKMINSLKKTWH